MTLLPLLALLAVGALLVLVPSLIHEVQRDYRHDYLRHRKALDAQARDHAEHGAALDAELTARAATLVAQMEAKP